MALVVNIDAPRNCSGCFLMGSPNCPYDGSKVTGSDYPNCPILGEIPDEHGRIVDISRVEDFLTKWENGELDYEPYLDEVLSMIRYSIKTIVEAST